MQKTQAMRVLDARGIAYETKTYDAAARFHSASEAAALLRAGPETVFKTLVVVVEGAARAHPLLVMAPADSTVDLKELARSLGEKKLRMATQREAERLTGMLAGGISALALRRPDQFRILIDESARMHEIIHVSAGMRGIDLAVRRDDLVTVTGAQYVRTR
jgi:Cys-tRNA(Pro)/Cys-tRNA(Cys) deacylase